MNPIEAIEDAAEDVARLIHRKENTVTDTAQPAAADAPPVQSFLSALHQNMATFRDRLEQFLPVLEKLAGDPKFDNLVRAALLAANLGVAEEVFTGAVDMLNAAAKHKADAAAPADAEPLQASFTPADGGAQP